ncbi:hypothetical protein CCE28_21485 [Anaeromicrobium sediminis]|uniref:Branched-chain amino acid ABC transporter permease n=2 Tax=Anaeromicrobium sediminis TaxID=1478221 RepID=A0A267M936_9FIRM|nr:hypothetical protein CCE28_21485 [Anaeromicrobium sediminis]
MVSREREEFLLGIKKTIPFMIGVMPFGLAYGIMASQAHLSVLETTLMSMIVFAGSAQFMAIGMISEGVGFTYIVISTLLINLRHLLMGLSLSPYFKNLKLRWLYLLSFGMTDEGYACTISYYQDKGVDEGNPYFMLGSEVGLYIFWMGSSIIGALLGHSIKDPLSWGLDFAMPATFLSIIIPQIKSFNMFTVFLVSGICAVGAYFFIPGKWYIIVATIIGASLGTILEMKDDE